jgi:hypothetical protein
MAYHMVVAPDATPTELIFDKHMGSGTTLGLYWEDVGRKLSLPIISYITDTADSESGFILAGPELVAFREEIDELEKYWRAQGRVPGRLSVPDDVFDNLDEVREGITLAIERGCKVSIA